MCPVGLTGLSKVEMIFCPSASGGQSARFSAIVLPARRKAAESDLGAAKASAEQAPGGHGRPESYGAIKAARLATGHASPTAMPVTVMQSPCR